MIITDGVHVTSTVSLEELHEWAVTHSLKRHWFHGLRKGHPHYDIPRSRMDLVMRLSSNFHSPRDVLKASRRIYEQQQLSRRHTAHP